MRLGYAFCSASIISSTSGSTSSSLARFWRRPRYSGSLSLSSLFVPTSSTMGSVARGWMPPAATYSESLPAERISMSAKVQRRQNASSGRTNADAQAVPALVAEPEDARAVRDDGDARRTGRHGPVVDNAGDVALVGERDGQALGLAEDARELLARLADSGCAGACQTRRRC